MSERNSVFVFKGPPLETFRDTMIAVVRELNGRLDWESHPDPFDSRLRTSHNGLVHAAYIDLKGNDVATRIGARLAIPWINLRIQEGSLWDYSLFLGATHLDNFSTLLEYWDPDNHAWLESQRGRPDILARTWGIEQSSIENYLRPWGWAIDEEAGTCETVLRGKAYPDDQFEYGDIWQMNDFLRSLGAHDPNYDEPHSLPRLLEFP